MSRRIAIVGAGLSGSLMALYLGELGHRVRVYERRPDPRSDAAAKGSRSINLGLSKRGIDALAKAGVLDEVLARAVPMRGRVVHTGGRAPRFQPYGVSEDQVLHSILRHDLNGVLIDAASRQSTVEFQFDVSLTRLEPEGPVATFRDEAGGTTFEVDADLVIGADGAFSAVRAHLLAGRSSDFHQEFLEWGYKELTIPARADGTPAVRLDALHVWPGDDGLIVAHPNQDCSLTATLFLAMEGPVSFADLVSPSAVADYLARTFPDAVPLMPGAVAEFGRNPVGTLVTIRTSTWHHEDKVVLVGDACHAVYPFYGQGMNSALEDCATLTDCLVGSGEDWTAGLAAYQRLRKINTDVLADLSKQNFVELRDRTRSLYHVLRAKADLALHRFFPRSWVPLYTMVSHSATPYAVARARSRRQDRIFAVTCAGAGVLAFTLVRSFSRRRRT